MRKLVTIISLFLISFSLCNGQNNYRISANARVKGRTIVGSLPVPNVAKSKQGTVVVAVKVDQYGSVTEAIPGAEGTSITDKELWNAARNTAMKAHFNMNASAPALQTGTITFVFGDGAVSEDPISEFTSLRDLIEYETHGEFQIKAVYNKVQDYRKLVFLVEQDDYIIPVQLLKKDLGAEKRFRNLDIQKGDTLTIKGRLSTIDVELEDYKGLVDASILDVVRGEQVASDLQEDKRGEPFQLVEVKPSFNGGDANEFSKWVNSHLVYPKEAKKNGIQGRVTLQYTIDVDGSVKNVRVLHGVESSLDKEAVRVVSSSPKWEPGRSKGEVVPVTYTFPVIFQLR